MKKMLVDNPVFKRGLNFTVRMGHKWYSQLCKGDFFEIDGFNGIAQVKNIFLIQLGHCEEFGVLQNEHSPACRTEEGLILAMRRAYPELSEYEDSDMRALTVTCVGFVLYKLY